MQSVPVPNPSAVSPGAPTKPPPALNSRIFEEALKDFKKDLSKKELAYFESVDFKDVEDTIKKIEFEQKQKKKMQNIARIRPFLDFMREYGKIVEVFLNTSNIVAYIWGPIKLLLTISSTVLDAFDSLLSAYEELGECLPLYSQYEKYFQSNPDMYRMLGYVYKDLLKFHSRVYKVMRGPMWKTVFEVNFTSFKAALADIRASFTRHTHLVMTQANLLHFEKYREDREQEELHFQHREREEIERQQTEVLEWLAMTSTESTPSTDQEYYASKRKEYPASGQWILGCHAYQEWIDPDKTHIPCIWLNGKPGAGKTVLASYIIEQACHVPVFDVGWFYCKFGNKDKNTPLAVIRGIISQLVKANGQLRPHILEAKRKTGDLKLISLQVGKDLVAKCLQALEQACIVIDGLDECEKDARREILSLFTRLVTARNDDVPGSLRILFLSTDEPDIRRYLATTPPITLKSTDNFSEMQEYARVWAKQIQELHKLTDREMQKIVSDVMNRADGMYLYCYLVFHNLYGTVTREDLDHELQPDCLPRGLGEAYDKILHRINSHSEACRVYVWRILGWMACSRRPLKWHEIQGALCMRVADGTFDQRRRLIFNAKELCGALVELQSDETVQFVHTSAREYIIRQRYEPSPGQLSAKELSPWIDIGSARSEAALTCVQYLTLDCFRRDLTSDQVRDFVQKGHYCFQDYAVVYWYDHVAMSLSGASRGSVFLNSLLSALNLFLTRNWDPLGATEQAKKDKRVSVNVAQRLTLLQDAQFPEVFQKLMMFATALEKFQAPLPFLNLKIPVERARALLEGQQVQEVREFYGHGFNYFKCYQENCLHYSQGFISLGERQKHAALHDRGFRCSERTCPFADMGFATNADLQLHMTSQHPEDVIFHKNEIHRFNDDYASIDDKFIVESSGQGHLDIVKSLIQAGISINTRDGKGMTSLHRAAGSGHEAVVEFLLESNNVDANTQDNDGHTALILAAAKGKEDVVRLLLERDDVDANAQNKGGQTALIVAVRGRYEGIVRLLLETNNVDTNLQNKIGQTALKLATGKKRATIAHLLREYNNMNTGT